MTLRKGRSLLRPRSPRAARHCGPGAAGQGRLCWSRQLAAGVSLLDSCPCSHAETGTKLLLGWQHPELRSPGVKCLCIPELKAVGTSRSVRTGWNWSVASRVMTEKSHVAIAEASSLWRIRLITHIANNSSNKLANHLGHMAELMNHSLRLSVSKLSVGPKSPMQKIACKRQMDIFIPLQILVITIPLNGQHSVLAQNKTIT